jgi:hypothetical protein
MHHRASEAEKRESVMLPRNTFFEREWMMDWWMVGDADFNHGSVVARFPPLPEAMTGQVNTDGHGFEQKETKKTKEESN